MTISEIRRAEAHLEFKAAAVSSLFSPVHRQAFESTLDGVLGGGNYEEKKQAAYRWMDKNYELVASVVYAAESLAEDVYTGMCDLDSMLSKLEKEENRHEQR